MSHDEKCELQNGPLKFEDVLDNYGEKICVLVVCGCTERALREKDAEMVSLQRQLEDRKEFIRVNAGSLLAQRDAKIEHQRQRLAQLEQSQQDRKTALDAKDALVGRLVSLLREWHEDWIAGGESDYLDAPTKALLAEIAPTPSAGKG